MLKKTALFLGEGFPNGDNEDNDDNGGSGTYDGLEPMVMMVKCRCS